LRFGAPWCRAGSPPWCRAQLNAAWSGYDAFLGPGDLNRDGRADLLARDTAGKMWLLPGTGAGRVGVRNQVTRSWSGYTLLVG
jgi:hypothetical protein